VKRVKNSVLVHPLFLITLFKVDEPIPIKIEVIIMRIYASVSPGFKRESSLPIKQAIMNGIDIQ